MHNFRLRTFAAFLMPSLLIAAVAPAPDKDDASNPEWVFSLLPKSLQKNPRLELTVITEMTAAGRTLPPVSPAAPVYFETHSSGFNQLGEAPGRERTLTSEDLEKILIRSLAANGYLPAQTPTRPPSLLIIYTWGSHNPISRLSTPERLARNSLDRAALVGGEKFAERLLEAFQQGDAIKMFARSTIPVGGEPTITPEIMAFADPINLLRMSSPKNEFLLEQMAEEVYFVVVSAYDYQAFSNKIRRLLWRTRMTVSTNGVSQQQTLPTLVLTAAPYFGRDMSEASTLSKRTMPEGVVEVGIPTVVESSGPIETPSPLPSAR